ncbi:unnamed protein product [Lactuca saligna]|uniref:PUA domain-containing protein n=1 Tax=Lactuca saligna TaxID=75948 RepID=A0AA35YUP3_LACSI|nr:unnamed protein product [Lactuca saligna]
MAKRKQELRRCFLLFWILSILKMEHYCCLHMVTMSPGVAKVILKRGKTQLFRDGSPMVYIGAVDRIISRPPPKIGGFVLVADGAQNPIGWGLYNRLMQLEEEVLGDPSCALNVEKLLETRIDAAIG